MPWDSPFAWRKSMLAIIRACCAFAPPPVFANMPWQLDCFMGHGVMPARRHADVCEQALAWDADLLIILGADQVYQPDILTRLVARWADVQGHGIIAAMVPMRGYVDWQPMRPFQPLAFRSPFLGVNGSHEEGEDLRVVRRDDGDFVRANIIGTGVLLFHLDLIRGLKQPWFYERVDPLTMHRVADMDSQFVARLQRETGTPLYVDTTIMVGHLTDIAIDDTWQTRFADWADPTTPGIDRTLCRFQAELPHLNTEDSTPIAQAEEASHAD